MTKTRVVLDTNVYLSGIIFGGNCRHILDLLIERKIIVVSSPAILLEISQNLEKKFRWNQEQMILTIKTLAKTTLIVKPKIKLEVVKSDKNDNKIVEVGVEGKADYIVSGDKHLLQLKEFNGIKIISPSEFLNLYFQN